MPSRDLTTLPGKFLFGTIPTILSLLQIGAQKKGGKILILVDEHTILSDQRLAVVLRLSLDLVIATPAITSPALPHWTGILPS